MRDEHLLLLEYPVLSSQAYSNWIRYHIAAFTIRFAARTCQSCSIVRGYISLFEQVSLTLSSLASIARRKILLPEHEAQQIG